MAITWRIHDEARIIHVISDGIVTYAGISAAMGEIYSTHPQAMGYRELVDTRQVERFDLDSAEIRRVVEIYRSLPEQQLTVLLATDPVLYGMGRMAQALAEFIGKPFAVCRDIEEACRALEVESDLIERAA